MAFNTTFLVVTTGAPQPLITTATTWAHLRGASLDDPVAFALSNQSSAGLNIYITGSSTGSSATGGFPARPLEPISFNLSHNGSLFAFTTSSTAEVRVIASRQ